MCRGFLLRYKTQLCVHFESRGSCSYGVRCAFAHGKSELQRKAHSPKEQDNAPASGKTPKVRGGGSRDGSSKGDRCSKSDLRTSNGSITSSSGVGGSSRNVSRAKGSGDSGKVARTGAGSGLSKGNGSSPRQAKPPARLLAAAAAAPAENVGSLGGGWDDSAGNLGGGWDAATLLDEAAAPPSAPTPPAKAAAPAHRAPPQDPFPPHRNGGGGGSFFDMTARGGRISSGAPATGFGDWLRKTPPPPVEAAVDRAQHSPLATVALPPFFAAAPVLPPPSQRYAGGFDGYGGRASEGNGGGMPGQGELGDILSRMGLGRFAVGLPDNGDVDVEAFALGAMGGHEIDGLRGGL